MSVAASTAAKGEEPCTKVTASLPPPLASREMPSSSKPATSLERIWQSWKERSETGKKV